MIIMKDTKININDFGITFCTVNGSGSATANNIILRAIIKMGIPVSGRNIFPSNIQGMPTKYSIRVSGEGYLGRKEENEILVCFCEEVIQQEVKKLPVNGILIVDGNFSVPVIRKDCCVFSVPVDQILEACKAPSHLKPYLANMVYVGIISKLIGIDKDEILSALKNHFNNSEKAVRPNEKIIMHSCKWAKNNISCEKRFLLQNQKIVENRIIVDGNKAAALGALFGGLQFAAWYPITPATGIAESVNEYIPSLRLDKETSTTTCVVVQAEDELASIGMVVGAGWAGLRSMTATSGPGLCLMSEFLGLAYFTETPIVVWDVQRVGPSTGLPTRTSQGDLEFAHSISHGDSDFIILLPADVNECFEFGWKALDIADKFQTPVIVLSDLELGMNDWVSKDFDYPDKEIDRGKILWEDDLDKMFSKGIKWGRYLDIDNDGVPYRTIPGNLHPKASYFARGTGHDAFAHYSEDPVLWENNLNRLKKKYESARDFIPQVVNHRNENNLLGLISYGSTDMAMKEVVDILSDQDLEMDYLRIRALPFSNIFCDYLSNHEQIFIVEGNRDGQMKNIIAKHYPIYAKKLISIAHIDGLSLSAEWIINAIKKHLEDK
jgi:2-oxoglutarate/2-oxoacid ferredoxin oxidoreductase subunit alpha